MSDVAHTQADKPASTVKDNSIIRFEAITKRFGKVTAVDKKNHTVTVTGPRS